jgi:hypothetical protein
MTLRLRRPLAALALGLLAALPLVGHADEGFWPFNRIPKAAIKQALGVDLSDAWLARVQQAIVRFPGGTGSFVSPDGLVLTNHHVSLDMLHKLSTPERDLASRGFLAATRADELRAPDLELLSLQTITDVTATVNKAVKPGLSSADALAARRAAIAAIEKDAQSQNGLEAEVVTLYQGAQYHLYLYKKYTDVRLVFAPEFEIAFFGGDPDNFTYPRFCLDMTLWRVYENGQPLVQKNYLPVSSAGTKEGDPVFTAGHPGTTQRLNTVAHLELLRDQALPLSLEAFTMIRDSLEAYGKQSDEARRQIQDDFFGIENSLKSWKGQIAGLKDPALMNKKRSDEQALRARVEANAEFKAKYGDAWDQVARARQNLLDYNLERAFLESGLGAFSQYFNIARTVVRWSAESAKPNGQRLPEYTDARKPQIERQLASEAPIYPGVEQAKMAASLAYMQQKLGADHPAVTMMLAGKSPAARAEELATGTTLGQAAARKALFSGGAATIAAAADPMIVLVRQIEPRALELRRKYDNEVLAVEREAYAKIAQAVFATEGDRAYPDATFTLRLSYGSVRGYREDGRAVAPYTELRGLYARGDEHGLRPPYKYPDSWATARSAIRLTTPFNFVTTNDIVGGNSGSPVISAKGELVGLIFDGNIQSLPGYFVYDATVNRAVAVDSRGILEALRGVYHADRIVTELTKAGN